jgi:hypothetical protein
VSLPIVIVLCVTALLITLIWASTKHQPKGK